MKQILFFTVLVLICIRTSAQNKDTTTWYRGGCFSILSGYAKPMSNYGEHEPKDDKDGWALPAINYEVNYAARFCSFASVMLSFKSVTNKFDDKAWVKHMQQSYPEPAYSCTSTTEPWKLRTVYLGVQFCLPTLLVKRLSFPPNFYRVSPLLPPSIRMLLLFTIMVTRCLFQARQGYGPANRRRLPMFWAPDLNSRFPIFAPCN